MLVLRKLYYASIQGDLEKEVMIPDKPKGDKFESKTPRICLYPTPELALAGLGLGLVGKDVYIYSPVGRINPDSLYLPTLQECPFRDTTKELWCLTTLRLSKVSHVKVTGIKEDKFLRYYNPRQVEHHYITYSWKDLDEKEKMTKVLYPLITKKDQVEIHADSVLYPSYDSIASVYKPGDIVYVYKPDNDNGKLPVSGKMRYHGKYKFRYVSKIQIGPGGSYKTLS